MKQSIIYIYIILMTMCVACTDKDNATAGDLGPLAGNVPIRFSVGNLVELQTRGTDIDLQNGTLSPGAKVGIFVMYERDYNALKLGNLYHNASYYYDNVECTLQADGSLRPTQLQEMFYPMGQNMKIAVFAYAPYDEAMTREKLFLPRDSIFVDCDQSLDSVVLLNDLLFGTPVSGNPLRTPITDPETVPYPSEPIKLNLRHQRGRLVMKMHILGSSDLLQGQASFHADTIRVYAENVPSAAPMGYSLDESISNFAPADSIIVDTLMMASYNDVTVGAGERVALTATSIVLPYGHAVVPSFRIEMISGKERRYIHRTAKEPVTFRRGTSISFPIEIDTCGILVS